MKKLSFILNNKQLDKLSDFLNNLSLVLIASLIIPYLNNAIRLDLGIFLLGIFSSIACLSGSLVIMNGGVQR